MSKTKIDQLVDQSKHLKKKRDNIDRQIKFIDLKIEKVKLGLAQFPIKVQEDENV